MTLQELKDAYNKAWREEENKHRLKKQKIKKEYDAATDKVCKHKDVRWVECSGYNEETLTCRDCHKEIQTRKSFYGYDG